MKNINVLIIAAISVTVFFSACNGKVTTKKKAEQTPTNFNQFIINANTSFKEDNTMEVHLAVDPPDQDIEIRYFMHTDLNKSHVYKKPLSLIEGSSGKAVLFYKNTEIQDTKILFYRNKATGKHVEIITQIWPKHDGKSGRQSFTDGLLANASYTDENWVGFFGVSAGIKVDLGKIIPIEEMCIRFLQDVRNKVFLPHEILFYISEDNENWELHKIIKHEESQEGMPVKINEFSVPGNNVKARYIKIDAKYPGTCPDWHPDNGKGCFMFADEVVVE